MPHLLLRVQVRDKPERKNLLKVLWYRQAPSVSPGVSPRFYCRLCKSLFVGLGTEGNQGWTGSETVYGRRGPSLPPPVPLATLHSNRNCHRTLQWYFVAIPSFGQTMGIRQTKQNGYRAQKLLKSKCSPDQTLQVALKPESPERAGCRLLEEKDWAADPDLITMVLLILIQPPTNPWFMISMVFFRQTWLWITKPWSPIWSSKIRCCMYPVPEPVPVHTANWYSTTELSTLSLSSWARLDKNPINTFRIISPLDVKDILTINGKSFLGNQK